MKVFAAATVFLACFTQTQVANAQSLPSFPGWRQYHNTSTQVFVDKSNDKYYVTDGHYDLVPRIRFDERAQAEIFAEWLTYEGQLPFAYLYAPETSKPYFAFFTGKNYRELQGETCVDFLAVTVRRQAGTNKPYLASSNSTAVLAGPFTSDSEAQTARRIADTYKFTRHCTVAGSNLNFFRREPVAAQEPEFR